MRELKRNWVLFLAVTAVSLPLAARAEEGQTSRPDTVIPAEKLYEQWWSDRHEANKARITEGNVDLLLLGDSITHHWDDAGRKVEEYYYGDRHSVNMGFGGDRTQHLLWRLIDAPMDKIHPKAAMVLIGVNNTGDNSPEEIAAGIKANIDKLAELFPDMKILLLDIFPALNNGHAIREKIDGTNALLPELFKDYPNVTLLDIGGIWLDENGDIPQELMDDGVHPTEYGYKLWGAAVEPVIAEMLGDSEKPKME